MKLQLCLTLLVLSVLMGCMLSRNSDYITVAVSKDKQTLVEKMIPFQGNENVLEVMTTNFNVQTLYHGAVFSSIEGLETNEKENRGWFYTINGKEPITSPREIKLHSGDRIEFDYHHYYSQNE